INGEVTVKLYRGVCTVQQVASPQSLFSHARASFDAAAAGEADFNVNASAPFIEHYSAWQWAASRLNAKG
ncbi:MAG: hypothetical protein RDV41_11325, partial [Planctomycetota bacterium]|nr:hypothetical protein [Planctomycetota bacterium]